MSILCKSILVGTGALIATAFMILISVPLLGDTYQSSMFVNSVVGCYLIGSPVSYYCMKQTEKYKAALQRAENLHDQLQDAHAELQCRARIDKMTGLLNREAFFNDIEEEKAKDRDQVSSLIIVDIDRFKQINDTWGHLVGDQALAMTAGQLLDFVGSQVIAGRIGGEEFAFFMPNDNGTQAEILAERIRQSIEQIQFCPTPLDRKPLTVSVGVACAGNDNLTSDLMRRADLMLYKAKAGGRNCVRVDQAIHLPGPMELPRSLLTL